MKTHTQLYLCLALGALLLGCGPQSESAHPGKSSSDPPVVESGEQAAQSPSADTPSEPAPEPEPPKYNLEQLTTARESCADLGIVLKEDADGNVISLDTAANRCWVNDYQMEEILVFSQLASLTLEGPDISDSLAPRIAEHNKLTSLTLRNTMIGNGGISQFVALESLQAIDLRLSPMVNDAAADTLVGLPELRAVRVSGCNLTNEGLIKLLTLPRLSELDLRNCRGITEEGIQQLAKAKSLRTLKIGGLKITDTVLSVVSQLTAITTLSLDNCDITDEGVAALANLQLKDLTIYQAAKVTDEGLKVLGKFQDLQRLTLRDVPAVSGTCLAGIPHPEKLVMLNLAQSGLTDTQAAVLSKMPNLQQLVLNETAISNSAIETLARLKSLQQLLLSQTAVDQEGASKLREQLSTCEVRVD